jgi:RNA polymerase sigma-70 factor (ECF subfamily)
MLEPRIPGTPLPGCAIPSGSAPGLSSAGAHVSAGSEEARRVKALVLAGHHDAAREAFAGLVQSQQRRASRLALYLLRDVTEADEAVQDTFVKVFTHITSYREDLPFEAWFNRILTNTCRDRRKSRRRRQRWELGGLEGDAQFGSWAASVRSEGPTPEESLLSDERRRTVAAAVDRLPARQREVFLLCHAEGQSPRDVGETTGLRESTVRVHLFRALRKLRIALEGSSAQR